MIRVLIYWIGLGLFVIAGVLLAIDFYGFSQTGVMSFETIGELWAGLSGSGLRSVQVGLERYGGDFGKVLWNPVILNLLLLPSWLVVAVLGLLGLLLGYPRRRVRVDDDNSQARRR